MALKTYAELDINITDINSTTLVPALNGRQGDNNREVFLWLKNGKQGYDLTGKTVTLYVKDAAGVVKTASTMNDQTGLSTGHFSLLIPSAVYQAPGAVQDSYIQIKQDDTVITSIPVAFNVVENSMLVTQTQSETYLDSVQQLADKANAELATMTTDLSTVQNAINALKITIANLNDQYNSDLFAQKAKDNEFKGNNTFDGTATFQQKIIAPAGLQGKADNAGQADEANHASNADNAKNAELASQLVEKNDQTVNNLTVNGYHHANGNTVVNKLDVNGQLFAHGDVKGFGTITSSKKAFGQTWDYGLDVYLDRVGNMVIARIHGSLLAEHGAFTKLQWDIPVGFRPVSETNMLASVGYSKGIIKVFPDGSAYNVDQTFKTSDNNSGDGVAYGFGVWPTLDDFPA